MATTQQLLDDTEAAIQRVLRGAQEWQDKSFSERQAELKQLRELRKELKEELRAEQGASFGYYAQPEDC